MEDSLPCSDPQNLTEVERCYECRSCNSMETACTDLQISNIHISENGTDLSHQVGIRQTEEGLEERTPAVSLGQDCLLLLKNNGNNILQGRTDGDNLNLSCSVTTGADLADQLEMDASAINMETGISLLLGAEFVEQSTADSNMEFSDAMILNIEAEMTGAATCNADLSEYVGQENQQVEAMASRTAWAGKLLSDDSCFQHNNTSGDKQPVGFSQDGTGHLHVHTVNLGLVGTHIITPSVHSTPDVNWHRDPESVKWLEIGAVNIASLALGTVGINVFPMISAGTEDMDPTISGTGTFDWDTLNTASMSLDTPYEDFLNVDSLMPEGVREHWDPLEERLCSLGNALAALDRKLEGFSPHLQEAETLLNCLDSSLAQHAMWIGDIDSESSAQAQ